MTTSYRVYDIGGGKFAMGLRNSRATSVVRRILTAARRGRPSYVGVRGVRPFIGPELAAIKPSKLLWAALVGA